MNGSIILIPIVAIAATAAMLAWLAIDIGTRTMANYRATFTERARFQAREFFLFIDPRRLFAANLAVMTLGATLAWLGTGRIVVAIPIFFSLALMPRLLYGWMRKRRLQQFEQQLPDALMLLAGGMRAGVGLASALQQLVAEAEPPLSQEFALVLREQRLGAPLEQALSGLAHRVPMQSTSLVVSAIRIASETGGGLAETLERCANTIRSRLQMEGKIAALTAQGKLQAWVVGLLPLCLLAVLNQMEPEATSMFWTTRVGWAALALLAFLEIMGIYVIRKIVAIDI